MVKVRWGGTRAAGRAKDAAHAKYIATRPGVAMEAEAAHVGYMADRPRSTGLFGPDEATRPDLSATMEEVRGVRGATWRLVISLREEDAQQLGWIGLQRWQELTRNIMPGYERALGLPPGALRWVAAHHPEPGHPHVHVLAWMAPGHGVRQGLLNQQELREVRRVVAREMYGPVRAELVATRTAERDFLVSAGRANLQGAQRLLRRVELEHEAEAPGEGRLPPRFATHDLEALGRRLQTLAGQMPGHGRVALAYMPPEVKASAREIADWILARPVLGQSVETMREAVSDLTSLYSQRDGADTAAIGNAVGDVRDRIAQSVLRTAADLQKVIDRAPERARVPAAAVAEALGIQWAPGEEQRMAELLRAVPIVRTEQGRAAAAPGPEFQAATDFCAARAPEATPAHIARVVTHQAARIERGERIEQRIERRRMAGGILAAVHGALERERRRAEAKAELWREYEAARATRRREGGLER